MAINLNKGQKVELTKSNGGLLKYFMGLAWNVSARTGVKFDLDAQALLLKADGKVSKDEDYVFYNAPAHESGAVVCGPDNREGDKDGYDECITVDLSKVPADIESILFLVTIYDADTNGQTFGEVSGTKVGIHLGSDAADADELNAKYLAGTSQPVISYEPNEDFSMDCGVKIARLYRHNGEWKAEAVGEGFTNTKEMLRSYGVNV